MRKIVEHEMLVSFKMLLLAVFLVGMPMQCLGAVDLVVLNISVTGPGSISASGYNGQACRDNCSYSYLKNMVVTLFPESMPVGYSFTGWGGDCTGYGICQVTMNEAKNVFATFADIIPPDTIIYNGFISAMFSSPVSFGYFFSDNTHDGSTFECKLNNESWAPCTSPYLHTSVYPTCTTCRTETPMSFSVRAKDPAGNYDPTPAIDSWTIFHPLSDPIDNVQDGGEVQLKAKDINSDLTFSRAITFAFRGGYSSDYMSQPGVTPIHGVLTIDVGTVIIENIAIAP